jgi:HK97 family phage portal protein
MKSWKSFLGFGRKAKETKASAAGPLISLGQVGQAQWTPREYAQFAKEAYTANAIAFRCMSMIAQSGATIPLLLNDGSDKEIRKHPVLDLIKRPAPSLTQSWLFESMLTYFQLAGNAYLERVGPSRRDAAPKELWSLRPDRMQIIPGAQGLPKGYMYAANGQEKTWKVDPITGDCEVLHVRRFHPLHDWYGLSAVEPAAYAIDRHNQAGAHNMAVLQNGATPSGALMFKPVRIDGEDVVAPDSVIKAAEKRLQERYSGGKNAGRPLALGGNVEWVSFGMTMEQLQLTESKLDAARDICVAWGVPIELLLPGQSTYNNRREAKLSFYEETVLPTFQILVDHLNIWLLPRFGEDIVVQPNLDQIEALSLRREQRQEQLTKLYVAGGIDRDELRVGMQYEPEPMVPQRKADAAVLTALINGARSESALMEPLYTYLVGIGLIAKNENGSIPTYDEWMLTASALLQSNALDAAAAMLPSDPLQGVHA